jgi:hypothetical protein
MSRDVLLNWWAAYFQVQHKRTTYKYTQKQVQSTLQMRGTNTLKRRYTANSRYKYTKKQEQSGSFKYKFRASFTWNIESTSLNKVIHRFELIKLRRALAQTRLFKALVANGRSLPCALWKIVYGLGKWSCGVGPDGLLREHNENKELETNVSKI